MRAMRAHAACFVVSVAASFGAAGCDEDWAAGGAGSTTNAKAGVAECTEPTFGFVNPPNRRHVRQAPSLWVGIRSLREGETQLDFEGTAVAAEWPTGITAPEGIDSPTWLLLEGDLGLALPAETAVPGQTYTVRARLSIEFYLSWGVVEVTDATGDLRALAIGGEVYPGRTLLEAEGWTATLTPVCWSRDCSDPLVHHDVSLQKGQQSWLLRHGTVADIDAGGRQYRVYNDAAALPGEGARDLCTDTPYSNWSLVILALD